MIQRIQTVYLLLAAACTVACLCLPIGSFVNGDGETAATLFNLWAYQPPQIAVGQIGAAPVLAAQAQGTHLFTPWALFAILVLTSVIVLMDIFIYRARLVQSRVAILACILLLAWYGVYAFFAFMLKERFDASFMPTTWAALPAVAAIFCYLAFRGILKDEMLVRSLDRLRTSAIALLLASAMSVEDVAAQQFKEQTHIHLGVVLPLKEQSTRGPKMVEFYQGVLLAVDSLRREGLFVDVEVHDCGRTAMQMDSLIASRSLAACDVIFGPLDGAQLVTLSDYCNINGIRLVQPFTTVTAQLPCRPRQFVVTAPRDTLHAAAADFIRKELFDCNYIVVDTYDQNEEGIAFANALRYHLGRDGVFLRQLECDGDELDYLQAFNTQRKNLVILNSPSNKALTKFLPKLKKFQQKNPECQISLIGFPAWQTYLQQLKRDFHQFDTFIFTPFYRNSDNPVTQQLEHTFEQWFNKSMANTFPRYGLMGFDLTMYFLQGISLFANTFEDRLADVPYHALQNPIIFHQIEKGSGFVNECVEFVHFTQEGKIEVLKRTE